MVSRKAIPRLLFGIHMSTLTLVASPHDDSFGAEFYRLNREYTSRYVELINELKTNGQIRGSFPTIQDLQTARRAHESSFARFESKLGQILVVLSRSLRTM
jgi:hypothetical protein